MDTTYNTIYTCNKCGKVEHRSMPGWSIECTCGGVLRTKIVSVCPHCGEIQDEATNQCRCGSTQLVHDKTIIKEILHCIDNNITTVFDCSCGKSLTLHRKTNTNVFCSCCGEIMEYSVSNLKKYRKKRKWSQVLMAAEIGISRRAYIDIESGKVKPSAKTRLKCAVFMGA